MTRIAPALAVAIVLIAGCARAQEPQPADPSAAPAPATLSPVEAARQAAVEAGLTITDLRVGKGATAVAPGTARVHYIGWLFDPAAKDGKGQQFDSSYSREQPFSFPLGAGRVIRGWDLGVAGMQVGGKRRLLIPPEMGYGVRGAGDIIPRNATLLFEVELLRFVAE